MTNRAFRSLRLASGLLLLSACTFISPPPVSLPQRDTVQAGETITVNGNPNVYGIARQYHVSMRELIVLNDLKPPYVLKPGQTLVLPATKTDASGGPAYSSLPGASPTAQGNYSFTPQPMAPGPQAPPPLSAPSGGITTETLPAVQSTPLPPPTSPGTNGPLPLSPAPQGMVTSPSSPAIASTSPSAATAVDQLNAPSPSLKPLSTTVQTPLSAAATAALAAPAAAPAAATAPDFGWPLQGPVLSAYGPKGQGLSNDGVNIGAPKGAPVVASANGIVVYAGSEMKGFGNLILIRHQGGWVTAYAHLDRALVTKDAVVARGDEIGTVGKTGNVPSPQLHFETRLNGKPVDPSGVIKSNPT